MNHDPRMIEMVHNVALGGNDDLEQNHSMPIVLYTLGEHHSKYMNYFVVFPHLILKC